MVALPAWYPYSEEAKPAPMPLLRVQALLNTWDPDTDVDLLADAELARPWLTEAGLLSDEAPLQTGDLELARALRGSMRSMLVPDDHEAGERLRLAPVRELARTRHPRLVIDDRGMLSLENPTHRDLGDGLFDLLLIVRGAQEHGSWTRLKVCANAECGWVFYDRSRNQQGSWCNMAVCGNRLKNRRLRARRR
jgi:CGNR zinc finger/Putative stress-induced transcription regulator